MLLILKYLFRNKSYRFKQGLHVLRLTLRLVYRQLSLGGDAELECVGCSGSYCDGVAFYVRPPMKVWKCVTELSGGERTMASLALVLSLQRFRLSPLIIVDEVDAALDCRNVSVLGRYFVQVSRSSQFLVVTLRVYMYSLADRMFGILKIFGGSVLALLR